jgi:cytochrome d ubiquinol oxidase subunit I
VSGVLTTQQAASQVSSGMIATTLALYLALYLALTAAYISVVYYLARKPHNVLTPEAPAQGRLVEAAAGAGR